MMMARFMCFLIGILLGACARPTLPPPVITTASHVSAASELVAKTVALMALDEEGEPRAFCSGVWVSTSYILTANHCVDDAEAGDEIAYVVRDDAYLPGSDERKPFVLTRSSKVAAFDADHDLALLRAVEPPSHAVALPAIGAIRQGAFAQAMGHSLGLLFSYSNGTIAAVRSMEVNGMDLVWVQAAVPISPGNSGGGLYDEDGDLIGIAHASYSSPRAQLLNLFVHRDYIRDFVASTFSKPSVRGSSHDERGERGGS